MNSALPVLTDFVATGRVSFREALLAKRNLVGYIPVRFLLKITLVEMIVFPGM